LAKIVQVNTHPRIDLTSFYQDGGYDVILRRKK